MVVVQQPDQYLEPRSHSTSRRPTVDCNDLLGGRVAGRRHNSPRQPKAFYLQPGKDRHCTFYLSGTSGRVSRMGLTPPGYLGPRDHQPGSVSFLAFNGSARSVPLDWSGKDVDGLQETVRFRVHLTTSSVAVPWW